MEAASRDESPDGGNGIVSHNLRKTLVPTACADLPRLRRHVRLAATACGSMQRPCRGGGCGRGSHRRAQSSISSHHHLLELPQPKAPRDLLDGVDDVIRWRVYGFNPSIVPWLQRLRCSAAILLIIIIPPQKRWLVFAIRMRSVWGSPEDHAWLRMDHGDGDEEEEEEVEAVRAEQQQHPVLHARHCKHAQSLSWPRLRRWSWTPQ